MNIKRNYLITHELNNTSIFCEIFMDKISDFTAAPFDENYYFILATLR